MTRTFNARRGDRRKRLKRKEASFIRKKIGLSATEMLICDEVLIERGYPSLITPSLRNALRLMVVYANEVKNDSNAG